MVVAVVAPAADHKYVDPTVILSLTGEVCSFALYVHTGWPTGWLFCIFDLIYAFLYGHLIIMILPCLVFSWRL